MKVKELKQLLELVPEDSDIILSANGHYHECDTKTHGRSQVDLATWGDRGHSVIVISANNCGWSDRVKRLNYLNYNHIENLRT